MSLKVEFGKRLKKLRKDRKMSQEQLAEKVDLSVDQISYLERGKGSTSFDNIEQIAHVLHCHPRDLFDFDYPEQ